MTGPRAPGTHAAAERVDWPALMRAGLGALRLAPEAFWEMTPAEFRAALEGAGLAAAARPALRRDGLLRLMEAHPDRQTGRTHGPRDR